MAPSPEERRIRYLQSMGITPWLQRPDPAAGAVPNAGATSELPVARMDWDTLRETVAGCRLCPLHESRTQAVFGVGDPQADWLIVGEAPGAEEDRRGEPFVGRAGQLLDAMLAALGLSRLAVYIANTLKCRPPNNRDPQPQEALACAPYLERQIELIGPGLIVALGRVAAQRLLETDAPLGRLRGTVHRYGPREIPVIVTYHPAYLLRRPAEKSKAWRDLLLAASVLGESAA
jgi:DNA polymerase